LLPVVGGVEEEWTTRLRLEVDELRGVWV
jgi:hypothetical protein